MATAGGAQLEANAVIDRQPRADVHADGRLVEDVDTDVLRQPFGEQHLCWLPPEKLSTGSRSRGAGNLDVRDISPAPPRSRGRSQRLRSRAPAQARQRHVLACRSASAPGRRACGRRAAAHRPLAMASAVAQGKLTSRPSSTTRPLCSRRRPEAGWPARSLPQPTGRRCRRFRRRALRGLRR